MKKHIYIYMKKALAFALAFAMIVGFWSGITPVSYTHLDVYKRQVCGGQDSGTCPGKDSGGDIKQTNQ